MNLPRAYLEQVVPQENLPADFQLAGDISSLAERIQDRVVARSLVWTAAIFQELRSQNYQIRYLESPLGRGVRFPDGFWDPFWPNPFVGLLGMSRATTYVGFLDPETEEKGFGIALHFASGNPEYLFRGRVFFPGLNTEFPLVTRLLSEEAHATPGVHPYGGTSTCWVEEKTSRKKGILTAKHCTTGTAIGGKMLLSDGSQGVLMNKGKNLIDAAWIDPGKGYPKKSTHLPVNLYPTGGLSINMQVPSGSVSAVIAGVTDTFGVLNDHNFPVKVYFDKFGVAGDSGSMVSSSSGDALAIYAGVLNGATYQGKSNVSLGYGQHIGQAAILLNLNLIQ
jgi:hypothetical protein